MISINRTGTSHTSEALGHTAAASQRRLHLLLAALLLVALLVRLDQLTDRTFGHPENFVPGLNVPDWVKYPPPRTDLEGVYRGTLIDGHPPGYFVAMLPWVNTFGSSLLALRLPSVLLGVLSVWLLFRLARKETDNRTAFLAAGLLALNGHHVFYSQQARMYVFAATLGLISSLLLWKVLEDNRRSYRIAYFAVATAMLWTQLYCWPLLLAQIVWATLVALQNRTFPVALKAQFAAVIAGSPVIQLSIYQNPPTQWQQSTLEYFGFGYAYYSESLFFGARHPLAVLSVPLSIVGLALILLALRSQRGRAPASNTTPQSAASSIFSWEMLAVALVATAILVVFPLAAPAGRAGRMLLLSLAILPASFWLAYALVLRAWPRTSEWAIRWLWLQHTPRSMSVWLALLPWAVMYGLSILRPSFVARGALVFVPYLLVVLAVGVRSLGRFRFAVPGAVIAIFVLHAGSVIYFRHVQSSGRDYHTLAERMKAELQPTDLILVRNRFNHPPLLYYLPGQLKQVRPLEAVRKGGLDPSRRVWVVDFGERADSSMYEAVRGRAMQGSVDAYGGRAVVFAPLSN